MYPADIEPVESGMLDVSDRQRVYWEVCGNPDGKPAVVLHGGPGSGCGPGYRRFFDPARYRIVLFDQRGCGRSIPHASDPGTDLAVNTTAHLLSDIEALRGHLAIERWLVFGLSWGSTLGLVYAQQHPDRVTEVVIGMVVASTRRETDWITLDMGRLFPQAWERFRDGVPEADWDGDLADAYRRLLSSDEPEVRDRAARDWCAWEDTHVSFGTEPTPDPRFADPRARMAFARLVTHYWAHDSFLDDRQVFRNIGRLHGIPGALVHGGRDVSSPVDVPWQLHRSWPGSELVVIDEGAHSAAHGMGDALCAATDRFADRITGRRG